MAHDNRVKPAYPTRTTSGSAIFVADITNAVTNFIEKLCWEWPISDPTGVSLADTDYLVNLARTNTRTDGDSPRNRIRRSYKWISTLVNIQHNPLSPFKEHSLALVQRIVEDNRSVRHILLDLLTIFIVFFKNIIKADCCTIV